MQTFTIVLSKISALAMGRIYDVMLIPFLYAHVPSNYKIDVSFLASVPNFFLSILSSKATVKTISP